MNEKSITKSNALIEAGYRLSLTEMQIVLYGISLINPLKESFPLRYRIDVKHFAEMFNREHGQIYDEVKKAILKRFWERDFSYKDDNGKIVTNRWLTTVKHQDKTGFIEIKFNEEVQPYLHQLKKRFTTYYIDKIANFKSIYSVRFYEYALMHLKKSGKNRCKFIMPIKEIKENLEIAEKYNRFSNFQQRVLEHSKKEINQFSDIRFSYVVKKNGKTPEQIEFTVCQKNDPADNQKRLCDTSKKLTATILEKAKKIVFDAKTGWDAYAIEQQFYDYIAKKGQPDNLEGAFIGFVRKKVTQHP